MTRPQAGDTELIVSGFPFIVIYRARKEAVEIVRILHGLAAMAVMVPEGVVCATNTHAPCWAVYLLESTDESCHRLCSSVQRLEP